MKVVIASSNPGKIEELSTLLAPVSIEVIPQTQLNIVDADEIGLTFIENAIIKARHACSLSGLPAIADDSGLAVNALNGAPGIYSARYAGNTANSKDNIQKLLTQLKSVPDEQRHAYFHCVLVFMTHAKDPMPLICQGTWHGIILKEPRGTKGFGYDPIFYVPEENKTAAELPSTLKNKISHRGQALQSLLTQLMNQ